MRRGRGAAIAVLVLSMALAGCSGGSDGSDGGSDGGPAPAAGGTAGDDASRVRRANLTIADFPPEWTSVPDRPDPADEADDRALAACLGRPDPAIDRTATADSDDFSVEEVLRASSVATLVTTAEVARADFEALGKAEAVGCFTRRIEAQLAREAAAGSVPPERIQVERLEVPRHADATVGFRLVATYSGPEGGAVHVDFVSVRHGRMELSAAFLSARRPFPSELRETLLTRMTERAARQ